MKISNYILNNVDQKSCGELVTTFTCKYYGFNCRTNIFTSNGELEKECNIPAMIKLIFEWRDKEGYKRKSIYYDSTIKEINDKTINEAIKFHLNIIYNRYKRNK